MKQCQNCKKEFKIESEDFSFYEKMQVPPPTFCHLCRAQRRLTYRNERKLFRVKDVFTGEDIFSLYPQESGKKVTTREQWFGDSWDATEHAREYNFSETFFKQFFELEKQIPIYNLNTTFLVNSPYSGNSSYLKNCHLCFNSNGSDDCMYGNGVDSSKNCVDNSHVKNSELCYECFWLENCYQCYFTNMSESSRNLYFCRDCIGCNDCFGCTNLRQASYRIFNKQYTKEGYQNEINKFNLNSKKGIAEARVKVRNFWNMYPVKSHQGLKNVNSTGSYVSNSKNVNDSYLIREGENMRYCQYLQVPKTKDSYDTSNWGANTELNYETMECGLNSYNNKFSSNCWPSCVNIEYSMNLFSCSDCFGCVGLKKKQYCIFNKQYTKEDYEILVEKIKRQMNEIPYVDKQGLVYKYGEFFPIEFSRQGYNNTVAFQHFPLSKEEAQNKNYPWIEVPRGEYKITKKAIESPELIDDVDESIFKEVFECENCKNAFRILENELIFLRKEKLPLPNSCHDCRYQRRVSDRLKIQLYERSCMCAGDADETGKYKNTVSHSHKESPCGERFKTGYSPDNNEIVYCEKCYQQEVY